MAFNYDSSQTKADKLIKKYGWRAVLRRNGTEDRECLVVETDFTPEERVGRLMNPTDRVFLISAKNLDPAPNHLKDMLVTFKEDGVTEDEHLKMTRPCGRLKPGPINVYYEIQVNEIT